MTPPQEIQQDEALTGEIVEIPTQVIPALRESTSQMPIIEMEVDGKEVVLHDEAWSGFHDRPIPLGYPQADTPIYDQVVQDVLVGTKPNTDLYQK